MAFTQRLVSKKSLSKPSSNNPFVLKFLVGLSVSIIAQQVCAVELQKQVFVPLGVEYDTNPDMSGTNRFPVWRYTIAPRLVLNIDDGLNNWLVDGSVLMQRHSNDDVVLRHREDPTLTLGWKRAFEFNTFSVNANYSEASSRLTEFKTTGVVNAEGTTRTKSIDANWLHAFSDKLTLSVAGLHDDISYTGVALTNYTASTISPTLTYMLNEKVEPFVQLRYSHYNPEDVLIDSSDLVSGIVGVNVKATDSLSWGVRAGLNDVSGAESRTFWTGGVNGDYTTTNTRTIVELARTIGAAGVGGYLESDNLKVGWVYDISQANRAGADFTWHWSRAADKYEARQFGGWYEHDLNKHWLARLSVIRRESQFIGGADAAGNIIGVTAVFNSLNF
jgi:hypothetical protein